MKFFVTVNRYRKDNGDPYAHLGSAYGPYPDEPAIRAALERLWPNKESVEALILDAKIISVNTLPSEEQNGRHVRRNGEWVCRECGDGVSGAVVLHPVLDQKGDIRNGERKSAIVLYCPNCETKPSPDGKPVFAG